MQGSYLIYGNESKNRLKKVFELLEAHNITEDSNTPDLLVVELEDKNSIGIEKARDITKFLSTKPFSGNNKAVIINDAHRLTEQAQNALLKLLEEPPSYALIFLNTNRENDLLDTVISRCQKILVRTDEKLGSEIDTDNYDKNQADEVKSNKSENIITFQEISGKDIKGRFESIEILAKLDRMELCKLLTQWIKQARKSGSYNSIEKIIKLKSDLETSNLNLKLGLEWLCLNL